MKKEIRIAKARKYRFVNTVGGAHLSLIRRG